ncbi:MAG: hypothetical protein VKK59_07920 [Vampirovibrionales bacterium]|nr:hypothetical protein [Vampirovibrionales bacterium]
MSLAETLNPETTAAQALQSLEPQLKSRGYSPDMLDENRAILIEFGKIASGLMIQEPDLEIPGSDIKLAFNDAMARQVVLLFMDGIEHALCKCAEYHLEGDIKTQLVQNLAQHVYTHTKQLVASTIGQEATPDIQFGIEQLKDFVRNSSETTLSYCMTEYERTVGPLHRQSDAQADALSGALHAAAGDSPQSAQPEGALLSAVQNTTIAEVPSEEPLLANQDETPGEISDTPENALAPVQPSEAPSVPLYAAPVVLQQPAYPLAGHEKLGALALMTTVLPAPATQQLINQLSREQEATLEKFRQDPLQAVSQMDVKQVTLQLKSLTQKLIETITSSRKNPQPPLLQLARLSKKYPSPQVLATVSAERPWVQWTVQQALRASATAQPLADSDIQKLSTKTQMALVQFIQAQL